jgi:DNA-binding response OmpR family regulator
VNKRLLIIDDEETILFALQPFLQCIGLGVQVVRELEEAEALAACCAYDLAIADRLLLTAKELA